MKRFLVLILLGGVVLTTLSEMSFMSGIMGRITGLEAAVSGDLDNADHSALQRIAMQELGIELFMDHPIVGIGMGNAHHFASQLLSQDAYLHNY